MKFTEFDSMVAKWEGKKHQASIGDVREIRRIIFRILAQWLAYGEEPKYIAKFIKKGAGRGK